MKRKKVTTIGSIIAIFTFLVEAITLYMQTAEDNEILILEGAYDI